jgi:uncharacterized protein
MKMIDRQRIPAPRDKVWAALNDPEVLKRSIPGCDGLEMISPTEMNASMIIKIGPVKAKFGGKVTLSHIDAPNGYRITGEGSGGVAGFAKGGATVRLEDDGPEATILHYDVDAQVGGKLAQLGGRLIESTAKKLAGTFFETFAVAVAPAPADPLVPDAAAKDAATDTPEGAKKGRFGGLFSRTTAAAFAVALITATALYTGSCCLFHARAQAAGLNGFPVCGGFDS